MKNLIDLIQDSLEVSDYEQIETAEYKFQRDKCIELFDELHKNLNDEQRKKLVKLSDTYSFTNSILNFESFNKGFRIAVRLILSALL